MRPVIVCRTDVFSQSLAPLSPQTATDSAEFNVVDSHPLKGKDLVRIYLGMMQNESMTAACRTIYRRRQRSDHEEHEYT
jgi:hypothetical protein